MEVLPPPPSHPTPAIYMGCLRESLNFASGLSVLLSSYEQQMNRPVSHCFSILTEEGTLTLVPEIPIYLAL